MDNNFDFKTDGTFQFTVVNGAVTAEQAVDGKHVEKVHIPAGATFALGTGTVTETLTTPNATYAVQFNADAANPALFHVGSVTETITNPTTTDAKGHVLGFSFTNLDGVVTAEQVVTGDSLAKTHAHDIPLPPGAQFSTVDGVITETLVHGHEVDVTTFVQPVAGGLFAIASQSETFIAQGAATTALNVDPTQQDQFTFASDGTVLTESVVHKDGTVTAVTPRANVTFSQIAPGFVQETIAHGNHAQFVVFHDGNGDGIYTDVAHGDGSHVDLAGLQAQLTTVEPFL
jgi:hypothetical protein